MDLFHFSAMLSYTDLNPNFTLEENNFTSSNPIHNNLLPSVEIKSSRSVWSERGELDYKFDLIIRLNGREYSCVRTYTQLRDMKSQVKFMGPLLPLPCSRVTACRGT